MQFRLKYSCIVIVAGLVAGCASPGEEVVNEDHQYVKATERGPLKLPQGAAKPSGSSDFLLPEKTSGGVVGEKLDIQSPLQLLALAAGSRLDESNHTNKIWFDKTNVIEDLPQYAFDALRSYLDSAKIVGSKLDDTSKTAITGWIHHVRESGFWSWGDDSATTSYRFKTVQKSTPNKLTTMVEVALIGFQRNGKDVALSSLSKEQRNRAETDFLNEYIYHYQLLQEVLMEKAQIARAQDYTLVLGENTKGELVFSSAKNADTAWVAFRTLLEKLGFKIDDVDRSNKKLFVTFAVQDQGFWSSLWGEDSPKVNLKPGHYVIRVTPFEQQSHITIYDNNEQNLTKSQYLNIEKVFVEMGRKLELEL